MTHPTPIKILKLSATLSFAAGALLLSSCHYHNADRGGHHGHGHGALHGSFNHHNHASSGGYRRSGGNGGYYGGSYCPTY